MAIKNFEASLLFLLVCVLVWIQRFDNSRGVEVVVGDCRVLEDDCYAVVPALILCRVVSRLRRVDFENSAQFHFFLQNRIVILLEEGNKFVRVAPFRFVVVLNDEWPLRFRLCGLRCSSLCDRETAPSLWQSSPWQ